MQIALSPVFLVFLPVFVWCQAVMLSERTDELVAAFVSYLNGNIQYVYRSIPQQLLCVLEADACQKLCEGAACGLFDQAGCMLRGVWR